MQQRLIAQAAEGLERAALVVEIEGRCAQIDLPSTPVRDKADVSPAASAGQLAPDWASGSVALTAFSTFPKVWRDKDPPGQLSYLSVGR